MNDYNVYCAFRKAQSLAKGKAYRLPKCWDTFKQNRMSVKNRDSLDLITGYFSTKWSNIDIDTYMECGFDIYKTFSYHMFFKQNILDLYIERDKQKKRRIKASKEDIDLSFDLVNDTLKELKVSVDGYNNLQLYCKLHIDNQKTVVHDYLMNRIDPITFIYCIYYKYITLKDEDREKCYNIVNRYRELLPLMFEIEKYIKEKLND